MPTWEIETAAAGNLTREAHAAIRDVAEQLQPMYAAAGWTWSTGMSQEVPTVDQLAYTIGKLVRDCAEELMVDSVQRRAAIDSGRVQVQAVRLYRSHTAGRWDGPAMAAFSFAVYFPVIPRT